MEAELKDDELLVLVKPHEYPPPEKRAGCLVAHENGKSCAYCLRCGEYVEWDLWESGCN